MPTQQDTDFVRRNKPPHGLKRRNERIGPDKHVGVGIGLEFFSTNLIRLLCPWFMQRWHRKAMPSLSVF